MRLGLRICAARLLDLRWLRDRLFLPRKLLLDVHCNWKPVIIITVIIITVVVLENENFLFGDIGISSGIRVNKIFIKTMRLFAVAYGNIII